MPIIQLVVSSHREAQAHHSRYALQLWSTSKRLGSRHSVRGAGYQGTSSIHDT